MTKEEKDKIIDILTSRKALLPCPRCNNTSFTLIEGYINTPLQQNLNGFIIGGPSIPSAAVACTKCGYLSQHALGILGILPSRQDGSKNDKNSK